MNLLNPDYKGPVSKLNNIAVIAFIISTGFILLRYSSYCGIIFTDDSFNYFHAAGSFLRSGVLISPDETPFASWPPLFSTVIALFLWTRIIPIEVLQYIVFLVNGLLMAILTEKILSVRGEKYYFMVLILLSVSMVMIHTFLWSEALFLTILMIIVFRASVVIKDNSWKNILILILLANVLCLQRNAGIFILFAVVLFLIFFTDSGWGKSTSLLFGGVISFMAWNIHASYVFTDGFNFLEHQYFSGFFRNIKNLADVSSAWFLPRIIPFLGRLIILSVTLLYFLFTAKLKNIFRKREHILLLSIIIIYTGAFTVLGELDYYEIERYLAVVYPFVMILVIRFLWDLRRHMKIRLVVISVLSFLLIYSVSRAIKNGIDWHERSCKTEKFQVADNIK